MTRKEFHIKAHLYLCILIAFFLPVYIHVVPALIALLTLNWIVEGNFAEKFSNLKKHKAAWLLIGFYLLHLFGMLWTENAANGWFDLEVKLSFILLPLVLCSVKIETNKVLNSFVYGCIAASVICFSVAGIHFINTGENHFEYTLLSFIMHPSYFSMYILLSISILLYSLTELDSRRKKAFHLIGVLFLSGTVVLLASKSGTVLLGLLLLFSILLYVVKTKAWILGLILLFISGTLIYSIFHFFPYTKQRLENAFYWVNHAEMIDKEHTASDAARILIWNADLQVIKENYRYGTGTGDIKTELIKKYDELGYKEISFKKLNAHNQFLQSTIGFGVSGLLLLLLLFIFGARSAVINRNFKLLLFIILTAINFLVESMLETQAGVIYFVFMYLILISPYIDKKK